MRWMREGGFISVEMPKIVKDCIDRIIYGAAVCEFKPFRPRPTQVYAYLNMVRALILKHGFEVVTRLLEAGFSDAEVKRRLELMESCQ